jgi:hypothetical protein
MHANQVFHRSSTDNWRQLNTNEDFLGQDWARCFQQLGAGQVESKAISLAIAKVAIRVRKRGDTLDSL